MQPGDQPFDDPSMFTQEPDALQIATNVGSTITRAVGTVRVDIGFEIRGLVGTGQHQIASGIGQAAATTYYFVELNDDVNAQQDPGPMHPGVGLLPFDRDRRRQQRARHRDPLRRRDRHESVTAAPVPSRKTEAARR